jgi:hypothetical protein
MKTLSQRIAYNKFHIMRHLAIALDQVRRSKYKRVNEKELAAGPLSKLHHVLLMTG